MRALLRLLLRAYPRPFREDFGDGLVECILGEYRAARTRGRAIAMLRFAGEIGNLLASAAAERSRPTWPASPGFLPEKGPDMRTVLELWRRDLIHAVRSLRRAPGFSAVTTLTLALAIGATAAMFSVVNTVLINPLPYAHVERLLYVVGTAPGSQLPKEFGLSQEFLLHYRERSRLIEDISFYNSFTSTLRVGDRVERIRMSAPTYTLFSTLGASPALGRLPRAEDEDKVAIISDALWRDWFGRDRNVLGRTALMSGQMRTIVGVMGPNFGFPSDGTLLWLPGNPRAAGLTPGQFGDDAVVRVRPGTTVEALAAEFTALAKELPARFGGSANYAKIMTQFQAVVRPLTEEMLGASARPLGVLLAAALMVFAIACANVANLVAVRAESRRHEMAVRQAIGARRGHLVRVQLSESLVIAVISAVVAAALARVLLPISIQMAPPNVPRLADASLDLTTTLVIVAAALVAALACGLAPALRSSAPSMHLIREGGRGSTGRRWGREGLVAAQTALALVLLIGSALLLRSYRTLSHIDPGYGTEDRLTFQIAPEQKSLTDGAAYAQFIMNFTDRLRALPDVETVGVIENVPLDEGTSQRRFRTEGMAADAGTRVNLTFAGEDYFKAMGIRVLEGRPFTRADATTTLGNAVISRGTANALWPGQSAIGRRLQLDGLSTWETVVGVVDDVKQNNFRTPSQAVVYFPLRGQDPKQWRLSSPGYVIKTRRAETIAPEVRAIVREIAPEAPMYRVYTMAFLADRQMQDLSFTMLTLGLVSLLALILGTVGLYGALSYVVAERTREIGVRMALGAEPARVRWMVVTQGLQVVVAGVVVGLIVARVSARALDTMVFGINAVDWTTFLLVAGTMLAIGLLASYIPARRASSVDPLVSLRGE